MIGPWAADATIRESANAASSLMVKVLEHLEQLPSQELACPNLQGKVYDPTRKEISKFSVFTNPQGITTITIYTRSLDQEDTLLVHQSKGRWTLIRALDVLSPTPGPITTLGEGQFKLGPASK